jgi:hypothetical protein
MGPAVQLLLPRLPLWVVGNPRSHSHVSLPYHVCWKRSTWLTGISSIGDGIEVLISLSLIRTAAKVDGGLPKRLYSMMVTHIILDFALGFIPVLGDLIDFGFRANTRNAWLLESYLAEKGQLSLSQNSGQIRDEDTGEVVPVPPELQVAPEDRDLEQGVEPVRMAGQAPPILAAVPPARTPAPKPNVPPPGRNLTAGRQPQDPRDKKGRK